MDHYDLDRRLLLPFLLQLLTSEGGHRISRSSN